jgi:hypothetical protein
MICYINTSSIVAMIIFLQSIYEADHKDQQLTWNNATLSGKNTWQSIY